MKVFSRAAAQKTLKDYSTQIALAAAGIATLGATYYAGKSNGKIVLVNNVANHH